MEYTKYANTIFEEIYSQSPANCTKTEKSTDRTIIDMGENSPGGWTSVKLMLDGLIGGRGIVNVSRDLRGLHQYPSIELLYDDPVGAYNNIYKVEGPIYGVKDGDSFALGICDTKSVAEKGNFLVIGENSLAKASFDTVFALADAVKLLLDNDVNENDILWAWSFSPVADLCNDKGAFNINLEEARKRRVVSIWLREDDEKLTKIVSKYNPGTLRLHNMVSARTIMVEGPAIRINC